MTGGAAAGRLMPGSEWRGAATTVPAGRRDSPTELGGLEVLLAALPPARGAGSRLVDWQTLERLNPGDVAHAEIIVTRRRTVESGSDRVHVHGQVVGDGIGVVAEGTVVFETEVDDTDGAPLARWDFGTLPWATLVAERLDADPRFARATGAFDGSIGLQCGADAVQLRIYKGRLLEVSRSTPAGPTFTLRGTELAWLRLALADRNDFIAHATWGRFSVVGDSYAYLRLTRAVVLVWDAIRSVAGDAA